MRKMRYMSRVITVAKNGFFLLIRIALSENIISTGMMVKPLYRT